MKRRNRVDNTDTEEDTTDNLRRKIHINYTYKTIGKKARKKRRKKGKKLGNLTSLLFLVKYFDRTRHYIVPYEKKTINRWDKTLYIQLRLIPESHDDDDQKEENEISDDPKNKS